MLPKMSELGARALKDRVLADLAAVKGVADRSSNLKGTFVRALMDAVLSIESATEVLAHHTRDEEIVHLEEDNTRLQREVLKRELSDLGRLSTI